MISLYVKTHNITGLKYLGKTTRDPYTYKGSGKYWLKHLAIHGNDVSTVVIFQTNDPKEFAEFSIQFSIQHNIVESSDWANLIVETGTGGNNPTTKTPEAKQKALITRIRNNKTWTQTDESNQKRSAAMAGRSKSADQVAKMVATRAENGYICSDETKRKISAANKGRSNPFTEEHKRNLRCHLNNNTTVACPHCGKEGQLTNMKRWHFDKCKHITNPINS